MALKIPPKLIHVTITADGATDRTQLEDIDCSSVLITAHPSNSGTIYIGDSNVTNSSGSLQGINLAAGESITDINVENASNIYVAADTANDKVICLIN